MTEAKPEWLKEALRKYQVKLDDIAIRRKYLEKEKQMEEKHSGAIYELTFLQKKVKEICSRLGVVPDWEIWYHSYAEWLWKRKKTYTKQDIARERLVMRIRWERRGLRPDVLDEIDRMLGLI